MLRPGRACRREGPRGRRGGFTLIELLVVMGILMILAGIITTAVFAFQAIMQRKAAGVDIQTFTMGLAAYKRELGTYPPADITLVGGSAEYGMNEVIFYYLGRKHKVGVNYYGPYVDFKTKRLIDEDEDTFMEYKDSFGNRFLYGQTEKGGYDIVSAGPDGVLGGTMDMLLGFDPVDGHANGADDVTQRSK